MGALVGAGVVILLALNFAAVPVAVLMAVVPPVAVAVTLVALVELVVLVEFVTLAVAVSVEAAMASAMTEMSNAAAVMADSSVMGQRRGSDREKMDRHRQTPPGQNTVFLHNRGAGVGAY